MLRGGEVSHGHQCPACGRYTLHRRESAWDEDGPQEPEESQCWNDDCRFGWRQHCFGPLEREAAERLRFNVLEQKAWHGGI